MKLPDAKQGVRSYGPDNLKFLLIFTVVLGHLLEISPVFPGSELLYRVIYVFHMPAFIFLAGYYAMYSRKRIIIQIAYAYILFQVLYLAFDHYVMKDNPGTGFKVEFGFPYWILWYLMTLLLFNLLIPLIDISGTKQRIAVLLGCFVLSLLVGFDNSVGHYISLSRFFSFLPFFVMGFYWSKTEKETSQTVAFSSVNPLLIRGLLTVALIGSIFYLRADERITRFVLYHTYSYRVAVYDIGMKLTVAAIAIVWIAFLFIVILPFVNRKIPLLSTIGRNSFSIYLVHGFLILLTEKHGILSDGILWPPLAVFVGTPLILILFGNPLTAKVFNFVFTGNWIHWLWNKRSSLMKKANSSEIPQ